MNDVVGNKIRGFIFSILCVSFLVSPLSASAHTDNSEGYSTISFDNNGLRYELSLDYLELARVVDLGITSDYTSAELSEALKKNKDLLGDYFEEKLTVFNQGLKLNGTIIKTDVERRLERDYATITFHFPIENKESMAIQITYDIFFSDNDPAHRNIVTYDLGEKTGQFVFTSSEPDLTLGKETMLGQSIPFIKLGFHHILIGLDHILFIIALVVTSRKLMDVIKIATLFTLAHSVTLGLTALELVHIPSTIVEPLIALSVAFVAIERFLGLSEKYRYIVVFIFGLIHGIGFAGALELSNPTEWSSIWPIFTFNVGVEFGQALIILLLFPILIFIRKYKWSSPLHLAINTAIFLFGITWYFQRFLS